MCRGELTLGNTGAGISTYVRNDNSDALCQVDSVNTAAGEIRPNGPLESNREDLEQNSWLGVGHIPGGINTSDGLAMCLSILDLKNSTGETFPE